MAGYIGSKAVITSGISATIDELNIIDGVTATTAELNIMDGVTSTAAELNILDGVTSTAAELNIMDGVTATAAEINLIDGGTARGTTTIADADGVLVNDAGTMRMTTMATLATYMGTKGLGPAYTRAATAPGSPNAGDWWFNTNRDLVYIYDGTDGWINNSGLTFGQGFYIPAGSFSVIMRSNLIRVPFEGHALGTSESDFAVPVYSGNHDGHSWGLSNSVRGVFSMMPASNVDTMEFIVMASDAASADFGNLTVARYYGPQSTSHATRGIISGGYTGSNTNVMDYITIASAGDATDFGDLTVARRYFPSQALSSTVRSVFTGGSTGSVSNVMDYVTIASAGNATDFGDLTVAREHGSGVNNTTRGINIGGNQSGTNNTMDYITIGSTGNATDFGDLTGNTEQRTAFHSSTIAYLINGTEQITMATAANATSSGYSIATSDNYDCIMPGWIAANG